MKGLKFILLGIGSTLGAFLRYKLTKLLLIFNTIPVNILLVNVIGLSITVLIGGKSLMSAIINN
jgi:CrcB protein